MDSHSTATLFRSPSIALIMASISCWKEEKKINKESLLQYLQKIDIIVNLVEVLQLTYIRNVALSPD